VQELSGKTGKELEKPKVVKLRLGGKLKAAKLQADMLQQMALAALKGRVAVP
jgi:hypothetical protein